MSKIGIKDLAQVLIDKYDLDRTAAERFISAAFNTLGHGLEAERMVKVRGLGTFKVTAMAPRKSVDVNTGEPIVIEGRDKISFTPENAMRDQVNRPFEQFETVELNDGVDFTAIDEKFKDSVTEESEEDTAETETVATASATVPPVSSTVAPLATIVPPLEVEEAKENVEEKPAEETIEPQQEAEEPVAEVVEPKVEEAEPKAEEAELKAEETVAETVVPEPVAVVSEPEAKEPEPEVKVEEPEVKVEEPETKEEEPEAEEEDDDYDDEIDELIEEVEYQHGLVKWLIAAVVALFIIGGGAAVYLYLELDKRNNRIEHLESQIAAAQTAQPARAQATPATPAKPAPDAIEVANKAEETAETEEQAQPAAATPANATNAKATAQTQKVNTPAPKKEAKPTIPDQSVYAKDARVRTGAYYIMGIDHQLTVRTGETLYGLTRRTLGPGMECYIQAVNGGRTEFKAGEQINIPKLKVKKRLKK